MRNMQLSPREQEIAGMVVMGHTNPKIAAALGIAVQTVKIHVGNIMAKYDITSRVALPAAMARGIKQ